MAKSVTGDLVASKSEVNATLGERPPRILTPMDHARVLHPLGSIGMITVARRIDGRWQEQRFFAETLPEVVQLCARQPDCYLTQNRFRGPRRITHLVALDALWADLDPQHVPALAHYRIEGILDWAYEMLFDARIPAPNYAVSTGRGLALVWLHEPVPRGALPRWRACQQHIYRALTPLGADRAALDPARVLRIVGSMNPKSGRLVEALTPVQPVWEFDSLVDEILPLSRGELTDLRIQRALRASESPQNEKRRPPQGFTAATLWEARLSDLQRLLDLRWQGTLPPGQRDTWLFLAGVAMSWLAEPVLLQRELYALAQKVGGWSEGTVRSQLQPIFRRAHMVAHGETVEWQGQAIDARYRFKTETILEWLKITTAEQAQLTTLISPEMARARHREAERVRKHETGEVKQDRQSYLEQAAIRRTEALQYRSQGKSLRQIAEVLGVSHEAVRKMLLTTDL